MLSIKQDIIKDFSHGEQNKGFPAPMKSTEFLKGHIGLGQVFKMFCMPTKNYMIEKCTRQRRQAYCPISSLPCQLYR